MNDDINIKKIKKKLESELFDIIRQVKQLKARANEIKEMLDEIEKAEITNFVSDKE